MGPPAVILSKKTWTTTQLEATDFFSAQQIYAEGSFQNNWIFNFSHRWITKPHVKIPPRSFKMGAMRRVLVNNREKTLCLNCFLLTWEKKTFNTEVMLKLQFFAT